MNWKIPLFKIYWDENDIDQVNKVIRGGTYWAEGPSIKEFEQKIAEYNNVKYAVVFNSGTSASHADLLAHDIKNEDEVIVPSFTFISTANSVLFTGGKPIFADIESKHFGLDPNSVSEKVTDKTKAIMPVHYGGSSCEIKALKEIAEDRNLILIEDNAEAMGATYQNKKLGTFGDSTMLSFCQNKVITTGEGGAVLTDSEEHYNKLLQIRSHGRGSLDHFTSVKNADYVSLGYNFRMPSMNAALGISQIEKIEHIIEMRQNVASRYITAFKNIHEIKTPLLENNNRHVFQLFSILFEDGKIRDKVMNYLKNKSIMSKIYFEPTHKSDFYYNKLGYRDTLEITENISKRILSLPIYPNMPKDEQDIIIQEVQNSVNGEN